MVSLRMVADRRVGIGQDRDVDRHSRSCRCASTVPAPQKIGAMGDGHDRALGAPAPAKVSARVAPGRASMVGRKLSLTVPGRHSAPPSTVGRGLESGRERAHRATVFLPVGVAHDGLQARASPLFREGDALALDADCRAPTLVLIRRLTAPSEGGQQARHAARPFALFAFAHVFDLVGQCSMSSSAKRPARKSAPFLRPQDHVLVVGCHGRR